MRVQPRSEKSRANNLIEGLGGKRALGSLLRREVCPKRSKFRMQFCLCALNKVLHVFLPKFASFSRYCACKNLAVVVMSALDGKDVDFR